MAGYEARNKVVLVTGGASGVGALTVRAFLDLQAKYVAFVDIAKEVGEALEYVAFVDIAKKVGEALEIELNEKYGANKAKFIKCDVTNEDELFGAYDEVVRANGHVDVVVNNAGIMNDSNNCYKKEIEINVTALITSTLKAIEVMRKDKGGKGGTIINISSIAALIKFPSLPIYFATKSAVLQFSNCMGMEPHYSRTGVRVVSVCFGATDTPLMSRDKYGGFDEDTDAVLPINAKKFYLQRTESAVAGVIEAFKRGASASTWLAANDKPPVDISANVDEAYGVLSRGVFP